MAVYKPKGSNFYWFSFTLDGVRVRENTNATNRKLAERIYHQSVNELVEKKRFPTDKQDVTFTKLIERYLTEVTPDKSSNTQRDERRFAEELRKFFGEKKLSQITADLVFQYKQKRKQDFAKKLRQRLDKAKDQNKKVETQQPEGFGNRTINRELNFLSATFNQAIKVWGWCSFNPVSAVKREKEKKHIRYFSEVVFQKILTFLVDWVRPLVIFARNTGLRRANVVNLKWTQVDLEHRMVILDASEMKNSEFLGVPLNNPALEVILAQKSQQEKSARSQFVFCKKNGEPYTGWGVTAAFKRGCINAGYSEYRFHDLRHDFCSQLVQKGIDLYTVQALAGHKNSATTQRYAHLSPERLRKAVSALPGHAEVKVEKKGLTESTVNP